MSDLRPLPPIQKAASDLPTPSTDWRDSALEGERSAERHGQLRAAALCLNSVRVVQTADPVDAIGPLRIVAWNLERCKSVEATADILRRQKADVCLLTEMDLGMARSGNRDTTADLAALLCMGHVFGTEFIELGHGDLREQAEYGGTPNLAGIHGNAVLSRFPVEQALVLPLDNDGFWYTDERNGDQRRIGGRNAIAVRISAPRPFWAVSVHYESRLGPVERSVETAILLAHLDHLTGDDPVIIGGDFNCKGILEAGLEGEAVLEKPETAEPMFAVLREAGYGWETCNTFGATTRNHAWTAEADRPLKKIDWLFSKGASCTQPGVIAAVDQNGGNLSDHEMIAVTIEFSAD